MKTRSERLSFVLDGLMDSRTVVLGGKITFDSINEVILRLIELQLRSSDRINLIIDSGGGASDAALNLCDYITTVLAAPVRAIAIGDCGSAATFVILHCNERVSTPYSRFLIHSGSLSSVSIPINQTTSENLEQILRELKATEEKVLQLYMNRLTPVAWMDGSSEEVRRKYVQGLIDRGDQKFDDWLSAQEALEAGLIDGIVDAKLNIFPEHKPK